MALQAPLELLVHIKLGAVVGGDGADLVSFLPQNITCAPQSLLCSDAWDLADAHESTLAFDDGDNSGLASTVHGIDFPVTEATTLLHDGGAFSDHAFACESAATVVAAVALALEFARSTQMTPERASPSLVGPNMQVDRFMAHHAYPFDAQAPHNLFRTEVCTQHLFDRCEVIGPITTIAPGAATAAVCLLNGEHRSIGAIVLGGITPHFAIDCATMPLQLLRDLDD